MALYNREISSLKDSIINLRLDLDKKEAEKEQIAQKSYQESAGEISELKKLCAKQRDGLELLKSKQADIIQKNAAKNQKRDRGFTNFSITT